MIDVPELMTVAHFCARYSIGKTSFYREVARNRIPLLKFGSATRIARTDAERWAESLRVTTGETA